MGNILINATEVKNRGGWVLDTQFVLTMGTPYLLAHGLGTPVDDAHQSQVPNDKPLPCTSEECPDHHGSLLQSA